jgi:spermidine synthase
MRRILILLLFFLSGAAALIYQVAWVRQAILVFGVSIYAYSAVLSAFMGGAALGSYLMGRRADLARRPLRFYALLQVGIAIFGIVSPLVLVALMPVYAQIAQSLPTGSPLVTAVRTLFSILILTPPTFLMGATLPVMARALKSRSGQVGSDVGQLYAADTLGAALGCGLAGLFLLRTLGTQETILLAAGLNLLSAVGAWLLQRRALEGPLPEATRAKPSSAHRERAAELPQNAWLPTFIISAYALSGMAALAYEVVWARILAIFTLDAVYSFSIMLTTFLIGLTVGGWIGAWWTRRRQVTLLHFANLQMAVAVTALSSLFIFARFPAITLEDLFGVYTVTNAIYYEFLLGFLALFVPTTLMGILFPVVTSLYTEERLPNLGERVGLINALNTAGAIVGALGASFVLIPLLGLQYSIVALSVLNLLIGITAYWIQRQSTRRWQAAPIGGTALLLALALVLPPGYYLGFREDPTDQMVYYAEGVETTVAVFDVPEHNFKVSFVNGRIEVPTDDVSMRAFRLLGHLPPLLKPDAQRALMLSFGNGVATGSLDTHNIPHIDAVDLSAEMLEAAAIYWQENHNVLRSPRLHLYVEDGRNFLLQTPLKYDIITTDATHPTNSASWALFTQEFYQSVSARLAPGGVFVQWVPFHSLREEDYRTILRTFQNVFPHATLWYTGGSHTLMIATAQPLDRETLVRSLSTLATKPMAAADLGSPFQVFSYLIMDAEAFRAYTGPGPIVTDNNAFFLPDNDDNYRLLSMMQSLQARATR